MASIGHIAVGLCLGRWLLRSPSRQREWIGMAALSVAALLPDADVIAFYFRIPYSAPWGHRGASHSLLLAVVAGTVTGLVLSRWFESVWKSVVSALLAVMSHGLLDALTDGGLGVALLWPHSLIRYFAPIRPLPVAPIGLGLLTDEGLHVLLRETLYFLPLFLYALWPRPNTRTQP